MRLAGQARQARQLGRGGRRSSSRPPRSPGPIRERLAGPAPARRRPARRGAAARGGRHLRAALDRRAAAAPGRRRRRRPSDHPRRSLDRRPPEVDRARPWPRVYEPYDREAARLFERGKKEKDPRVLDEVCRAYPVARVVPDALLELGSLYESARRLAEAAHTYKRLLSTRAGRRAPRPGDLAAGARLRSAEALRVGPRQLPRPAGAVSQDHVSKNRRSRGDGRRAGGGRAGAAAVRPADRRPSAAADSAPARSAAGTGRPRRASRSGCSAPEGVAPSLDAGRLFLVEKTGLRLLDPSTGSPRWSSELGAPAVWAGYLADKLIAATPRQIVALELGQGTVQWRYRPARGRARTLDRPDPFADANGADADRAPRPAGRDLVRLSAGERARLLSARPPRADRARRRYRRPRLVVLGSAGRDQSQSLDRRRSDGPPGRQAQPAAGAPDRRRPAGHAGCRSARTSCSSGLPCRSMKIRSCWSPTAGRSRRFDLNHGQTVWVYQESKELPVNGPPRLLGDCRAPAGLARRPAVDPARPGHRLETLVVPARDAKT